MSVWISCVKLNYSSFSREHTLACSAHFNDTVAFFAFSKPPFLLALICLYFWFYSWSATVTMLPSGCLLNLCKNTSSLLCPACWSRMEYSQIHHSWHVHVVWLLSTYIYKLFQKAKETLNSPHLNLSFYENTYNESVLASEVSCFKNLSLPYGPLHTFLIHLFI